MEINPVDYIKEVKELFDSGKFEEIIALLTDNVLKEEKNKEKAAELYIWRGTAQYNINKYDEAITDYDKAIENKPKYALAYYNRGLAWGVKKEDYDKAIEDYDKVIEIDSKYAIAYVSKGSILRFKKEYSAAIDNFNRAIEIDPDYASAYYYRGLAKKENNDLEGSKQDFEKYIELTAAENDTWAKYASYYIEDINVRITDTELSVIIDLIADIKNVLLFKEDCITHYTSLSVLKSLILDSTKFRISEGNFMNDPSEGKEFFNFLEYTPNTSCKDVSLSESYSPKPFIGCFVTKDKHDDLNMWRFYGKEEGVEAKGCSITLSRQEFIDDINNSLPKEEEDYRSDESDDINFYRVVYLETEQKNFYIPDSDKGKELKKLMVKLKKKVTDYKKKDKTFLEKRLNSIAFLFKNNAYKNENEVRMVVKGVGFKKKYDMDKTPPRVYIELESIKKRVKQITLGPKVDKVNEWASVFHHSYEGELPEIIISCLPYR